MTKRKTFYIYGGLFNRLRPYEKIIFILFYIVITVVVIFILRDLNQRLLISTPAHQGLVTLGVEGTILLPNPLFEVSEAEKTLNYLIHSTLFRAQNSYENVPILAKSATPNEDATEWTVNLKNGVKFHDGSELTSEDVEFTFNLIQEEDAKIPLFDNWRDVSVRSIDKDSILFELKEPNSNFPSDLAVPILPEHVWSRIPVKEVRFFDGSGAYVGAGPFKLDKWKSGADDRLEEVQLETNEDYILGEPYIRDVVIKIFENDSEVLEAFLSKEIDILSKVSPSEVGKLTKEKSDIYQFGTEKVFALLFNSGKDRIFSDDLFRASITHAINKPQLVNNVLRGFAVPINGPSSSDSDYTLPNLETINNALNTSGWIKEEDSDFRKKAETLSLSFKLLAPDVEELRNVAHQIRDDLKLIGADVIVEFKQIEEIKNMEDFENYDVILYGYDLSTLSLDEVWGGNSPISNFITITDKIQSISEQFTKVLDKTAQKEVYNSLKVEILKNLPIAFVYSPNFIFLMNNEVKFADTGKSFSFKVLMSSNDLLLDIHKWYFTEESYWPIFKK